MKYHYDEHGEFCGYELDLDEDFKASDTSLEASGFDPLELLKDPFAAIMLLGLVPATILGPIYSFFHVGIAPAIFALVIMIIVDVILFRIALPNAFAEYKPSKEPVIFVLYHFSWFALLLKTTHFAYLLFTTHFTSNINQIDKVLESFAIIFAVFLIIQKLCHHFRKSDDPR